METEKNSYLKRLSVSLMEWDRKIDEFMKEGNKAATMMEEDFNRTAKELKSKKQEIEVKINEFRNASGESWKELKKGAEIAMEEFSEAFTKAKEKITHIR